MPVVQRNIDNPPPDIAQVLKKFSNSDHVDDSYINRYGRIAVLLCCQPMLLML